MGAPVRRALVVVAASVWCCGAPVMEADAGAFGGGLTGTGGGVAAGTGGGVTAGGSASIDASVAVDAGTPDSGADAGRVDAGVTMMDAGFPRVDRTAPQLFQFQFRPSAADPDAGRIDATQLAALDTRVTPRGQLVVYLHGAGVPTTCGSTTHNAMLASWGYHVISPCYLSDYGVGNCGTDIGGCRLEAFDGVDRTTVIDVKPSESIEVRVVRMLERLATLNPQGDWRWFIVNGKPR